MEQMLYLRFGKKITDVTFKFTLTLNHTGMVCVCWHWCVLALEFTHNICGHCSVRFSYHSLLVVSLIYQISHFLEHTWPGFPSMPIKDCLFIIFVLKIIKQPGPPTRCRCCCAWWLMREFNESWVGLLEIRGFTRRSPSSRALTSTSRH